MDDQVFGCRLGVAGAIEELLGEALDTANAKYAVVHPELADITGVYGTIARPQDPEPLDASLNSTHVGGSPSAMCS